MSKTISRENTFEAAVRANGGMWDNGQYIVDFPLCRISVWEDNPRKQFDEAGLQELADSIREHGVQQPIVVRYIPPDMRPKPPIPQKYLIVMGERRYRASYLAERETIPVIVRTGMDDATALTLAMAENVRRRDLNALEEAKGYGRLVEMGRKQAEIARELGCDPSTVANARRLLKLPEDVQDLVASGTLSAGHGRAILRWEQYPVVMSFIAKAAVDRKFSVRDLEDSIPFADDLVRAEIISAVGYRTLFPISVCEACPFGAYHKTRYAQGLCFKPSHLEELNREARAEQIKKAQADAELRESQRQVLIASTRTKPDVAQAISDAFVPAASATGAKDVSLVAAEGPKVLDLGKLRHDAYVDLSSSWSRPPATCTGDCPCRAKGLDSRGACIEVCLDPNRHNSLKAALTKQQTKERRIVHAELLEELAAAKLTDCAPSHIDHGEVSRLLAMLLWRMISHAKIEDRRKIALTLPPGWVNDNLATDLHMTNDREAWTGLAELGVVGIVNLAVELTAREELRQALEYKSDRLPQIDWILKREPSTSTLDDSELSETEQPDADETAIDEDEERVDAVCCRCGVDIPMDHLGEQVEASVDGAYRLPSGVLCLRDEQTMYCRECAPDVQICLGCGCTDELGCDNGCTWIALNWCSNCHQLCEIETPKPPEPPTIEAAPKCRSCGVGDVESNGYCGWCDPAASAARVVAL